MKKKLLIIIALTGLSLLGATIHSSGSAYANNCYDAKDHLFMSTSHTDVLGSTADLGGGSDGGVKWACDRDPTPSGVIFVANDVTINSDGQYTVYPDITISSGSTTRAYLYGMLHRGGNPQYASHIGFCIEDGDCRGTGKTGSASINSNADGATAGGIISSGSGGVLQRAGSNNKQASGNSYWALPYYWKAIDIDNSVLLDKIKNYSTSGLGISDSLKNGGSSGWVRLYIHRCFSTNSQGTVSGSSTCEQGTIYLFVDNVVPPETTYDGKVEASGGGNTESTSKTVKFKHYVKRKNDGPSSDMSTSYWIYHGKKSSEVSTSTPSSDSGTKTLSKNSGWKHTGDSHDWSKSLSLDYEGANNSTCSTIGIYEKGNNDGYMSSSTFLKRHDCASVHRYAWYTFDGNVAFDTNAVTRTGKSGYWIDDKTANLKFVHQLKRNTTAAIQTQYKTSKNPTISNDFGTVNSYTDSTVNVSNTWYNQYSSPSSRKPVTVAINEGTKYCQTLYWYSSIREDGGNKRSPTSTEGCITFRRYKSTFSGVTEVFTSSGSTLKYEDNTSVDTSKNQNAKRIYVVGATTYPATVTVSFKHSVTRSSNDPDGSPNGQKPKVTTHITDHTDIRSGDDYGTEVTDKEIGPIDAGKSANHTDTFTVKVYPEHKIKLCQYMTYSSEIQGKEQTATADTSPACVEIYMRAAECFGEKYGIKNGKNYLQAQIYKNTGDSALLDSGVKHDGSTTLTAWAKPGDQIRFNYAACAGAELARQYADTSGTDSSKTEYKFKPNKAGYLFGDTLSASPYNSEEKKYTSNSTLGKGPFPSDSYTLSVTSPSGNGIYSCSQFGSNNISDFYRIPAYYSGLTEPYNCKSKNYGNASAVGKTIQQTASWSDMQYTNASRTVNTTANVISQVKVPYNYLTEISTSGGGGYLLPGTTHTEHVKLKVIKRPNDPVGGDEYATVTKPSKYRIIEIIVGTDRDETSGYINGLVNGQPYFGDSNGSKDLASSSDGLKVCEEFNCQIKDSGEGRYSPDKNGLDGQTIGSWDRDIPHDIDPGVKYCYLAAIWPSDSHKPSITDITASDNETYGMVESGVDGFAWHVSGLTCFTVAKRPSIAVLNGETYAQRYITGQVSRYPTDGDRNKMRIYGSWSEYGLVAGRSIQGYASGATLWGGSNRIANAPDKNINCTYSPLTFANKNCSSGTMGSVAIDTTSSSDPKNLTEQIRTRFTRSDAETAHKVPVSTDTTTPITNAGTACVYGADGEIHRQPNTGNFECINETGAKYIRVNNGGAKTASIQTDQCLDKGNSEVSHTTIFHSAGTLVVGANLRYGSGSDCSPETYSSIAEVPQFVLIANRIVIKSNVEHIDGWLIANEIITCDPSDDWEGSVTESEINSKVCTKQLTINGSVLTKKLKLFRTHGAGFGENGETLLASPAEVFTMGPESYFWSFGQAERYSQATTTYARELAPRY